MHKIGARVQSDAQEVHEYGVMHEIGGARE